MKRYTNPTGKQPVSRTEKGEQPMYETPNRYEIPDIVYEGDLEVQAGSPVGAPILDDLEKW